MSAECSLLLCQKEGRSNEDAQVSYTEKEEDPQACIQAEAPMLLLHKSEFLLHPDSPEPLDPTVLQLSMCERLNASLADLIECFHVSGLHQLPHSGAGMREARRLSALLSQRIAGSGHLVFSVILIR